MISPDDITVPDEEAQNTLLDNVTAYLEAAVHEGQSIATGTEQRGLISALKNLAGRAVAIVGGIVTQIREKVKEIIDSLVHGNDVTIDEIIDDVETIFAEWAGDYADMIAQTEIHSAVEEAIMDVLRAQGVTMVRWIDHDGACEVCIANAQASPLALGATWPSGSMMPPAHPRCRCNIVAV